MIPPRASILQIALQLTNFPGLDLASNQPCVAMHRGEQLIGLPSRGLG